MIIYGSVKGLFNQQTLLKHKFAQLYKVTCKWFVPVQSEGIPMPGPIVIEKAKSLYNEMKINDCTFYEGW
jgi:hypothetical protein